MVQSAPQVIEIARFTTAPPLVCGYASQPVIQTFTAHTPSAPSQRTHNDHKNTTTNKNTTTDSHQDSRRPECQALVIVIQTVFETSTDQSALSRRRAERPPTQIDYIDIHRHGVAAVRPGFGVVTEGRPAS